jgi:DNA mismatch repair protein MutL
MRDALRKAKLTPEVKFQDQNEGASSEKQQNIKSAIADFFDTQKSPSTVRPSYSASRRGRSSPRQRPIRDDQRFFQVLNRYIVEECDDSIQIIDQHALHERILYEHIRQELADGPLNSQQLLVPDLVELTQPEFYAVMDMKEDLAEFGMKIEAFGEKTIIVRSVPQILRKFDGASFFRELIEEFGGPGKARRLDNRIDQLAKLMACKGAVKAGQALDRAQLRKILEQRAAVDNVDTCPHGRPTTILLTRKKLDEQFERT